MAIMKKISRQVITRPDNSEFTQDIIPKPETPLVVDGGEHIVRQDIQNGNGLVIMNGTNAVSVDRSQFYNIEDVDMIESNITTAYKAEVVDRITDYHTDKIVPEYATYEYVDNFKDESMNNYTLKTVTNQVWTTSVTTFATKKELDEIAKKYGIGMVIMGSVPSMETFTTNPEYSADNPKRFQGETYFTSDLKHMWQFVLKEAIVAGPQLMIDKVDGFRLDSETTESTFQIWLGREHSNPDEDLTIRFGGTYSTDAIITLPGSTEPITELTVKASLLSPSIAGTVKLTVKSTTAEMTPFERFITFTTYAGAEQVPQVLAITSPIYFNGFIPAGRMTTEQRAIVQQNKSSKYKISSSAVKGSTQKTRAILPGDEFIGTSIDGIYGSWVNIGPIVGPPNELIPEVLVTTIPREYVTVAGSLPNTDKISSTASISGEYPNQQLNLSLAEGVQGAPGVRGYIGNKITPSTFKQEDVALGREVQMIQWAEYDWDNTPIEEALEDPNNPNSVYPDLPPAVRIEGLDSYEVWKDHYSGQGATPDLLTKENYFLDITGDSAFKFWKDYKSNMTPEDYDNWVQSIPGIGDWFQPEDVEEYLAFQKGDVYVPMYNESNGVLSYEYVDSLDDPTIHPGYGSAISGFRVRGQVYEPSIDHNSGVISFTRKNEESTNVTVVGENIRGNVWVPSVNVDTGELSWANTRDTNNPTDVTPTYIYGPIYEPVITREIVPTDWTVESGFTGTYQKEVETLTWQPVRKPTSLQLATDIKGLKGSPVKVELNLVNDVSAYDEFNMTISAPSYTETPDHIGVNTQILSVFTPFDKYNFKIHSPDGDAWYVGVDNDGRLVTSGNPHQQDNSGAFVAIQRKKMADMRKQIEELKATINLMREED